ncbi:MAG: hypothetical protein A2Y40_08510 [Candidatus Margulisbacteria bacterium GWF2_35_9]|nr:MAG: hypothetical protein A2Y40_08510 [Candidatus Margulisbacteria bacterium GWF2_35_9]
MNFKIVKHYLLNRKFSRTFIINSFLANFKHKTSYLEIGVRRGENIISVKADIKIGVDPCLQLDKLTPRYKKKLKKSNNIEFHEIKSDEYFLKNDLTFDVVFIDGLHVYEQAMKDILNALNLLKENGVIVVHDCNPLSEKAAQRNHTDGVWNGDVWKVILDISENYSNLDYFVLDADFGLGIISKKNNNDKFLIEFKEKYIDYSYDVLDKSRDKFLKLKKHDYFNTYLKTHKKKVARIKNFITGVIAVSDYEPMDYIVFKESIESAKVIADKLIIVYGGSLRKDDKTPVLDYLKSIDNSQVTIKNFDWPEKFNWTQFSLNYNYGLSFIDSKWCLFLTCDEIIPQYLKMIKWMIKFIPWFVDYISLTRLFLVNKNEGTVYTRKRIIFRNKPDICFGMVSESQPNAMHRDFGRLINLRKWYDGKRYVNCNNNEDGKSIQSKMRQGELLRGFRDFRWYKTFRLPFYYINTHTLFMPEEYLLQARNRSYEGYTNLPDHYKVDLSNNNAVMDFKDKLESNRSEDRKHQLFINEKKLLANKIMYF